jgi:hypothetical protein
MSAPKHTPGPWTAEFDITVQGLSCWRIESPTVRTLAALTFVNARDATSYGAANARLIAAAPKLLAALRQFVSQEVGNEGNEPSDAMIAARAAIADAVQS